LPAIGHIESIALHLMGVVISKSNEDELAAAAAVVVVVVMVVVTVVSWEDQRRQMLPRMPIVRCTPSMEQEISLQISIFFFVHRYSESLFIVKHIDCNFYHLCLLFVL
jgi:amino acid permease